MTLKKPANRSLAGLAVLALLAAAALALAAGSAYGEVAVAGKPVTNPLEEMTTKRRLLAETMEKATVWILVFDRRGQPDSSGSGFIVADNHIMTNGHVVWTDGRVSDRILVLNRHMKPTEAKVVAIDYDPDDEDEGLGGRDFALLRFDPPRGVETPVLSFNLEARTMDLVGAWGFPGVVSQFDRNYQAMLRGSSRNYQSPSIVFTEGTVNALVDAALGKVIMHSAQVSRGNSGGPLVNILGEVVGINTMRYARKDDLSVLNIALGTEDILPFLAKNGVQPRLASGQTMASLGSGGTSGNSRSGSGGSGGRRARPAPQTGPRADEGRTRLLTSFKIDVPRGWGVVMEEDDTIIICADDKKVYIGVVVSENEGLSLEDVARAYSLALDGTRPIMEDGTWVFNIDPDGEETFVAVSDLGEESHVMVFLAGDFAHSGVVEVLDSLDEW